MPTRRVMQSVLHNFLGTLTSRYSDYEGYWLWGFVDQDLPGLDVDLLEKPPSSGAPLDVAVQAAIEKFREQMSKAGLPLSVVSKASLRVSVEPNVVVASVNGLDAEGRMATFRASAELDDGHSFERKCEVFVAHHDEHRELRSVR